MARGLGSFQNPELTLRQKLWQVNWTLLLLVSACAAVGVAMLYSAANGSWEPWASRHAARFGVCALGMLIVALIDVRQWMRHAYTIYGVVFVLLAGVEIMGSIGMGAQRWIDLKVIQLQPSEIMKIAIVLALARYFHGLNYDEMGRMSNLAIPLLLVAAPTVLILRQPDLGTAIMLVAGSAVVFFLAGVRLWKFVLVGIAGLSMVPIAWNLLHEYQKKRVLIFLDPERDPLGSGYHILQSKIAMGSGGISGKGFIQGTQSHLNFLPEKHTDFIFTMLGEEFGLFGGLALIVLFCLVIAYGFGIAVRARSQFARLMAMGVTTTFSLYVFINIAMVMGVIPVVGVPLPLVSYGGTAMLTVMFGFGLLMNAYVHRDVRIGRRWADTP